MMLKQHQEHLEDELRGFKIRNREYEDAVYGLPQVRERVGGAARVWGKGD